MDIFKHDITLLTRLHVHSYETWILRNTLCLAFRKWIYYMYDLEHMIQGIQRSCDYIYIYIHTSILNWFTHIQPLLYIIQYKILLTSMHVKLPLKYMLEIESASRIFYIYIQELNLDRNIMLYLFVHDFFIL